MAEKRQDNPGTYTGPERRRGERRRIPDRRQAIRFELNKPDRRSGKDRRKSNVGGHIWDETHLR